MSYRKIWEKHNGPIPVDEQGRSYEIHHIDGNRANNSLNNLICVSIQEHYDIHLNQGDNAAAHAIAYRLGLSFEGWKHSASTRQKISEKNKGENNPMYGKQRFDVAERNRLGKGSKRKPFTDEHLENMSKSRKGRTHPKSTCPHCNKEGANFLMFRWHFDNCKKKLLIQ